VPDKSFTPLGRKLVAAIMGTTLLALVLSFVLNILPMAYSYHMNITAKAQSLTELMATSLVAAIDFQDASAAKENLATLTLVPNVTGAAVYNEDNDLFAAYGSPPAPMPTQALTTRSGLSNLLVAVPVKSADHCTVLVIEFTLTEQWSALENYVFLALTVFLVVLIICFKVAGFFRRQLEGPLQKMTETISGISGSKDYSRRVSHVSNDELGMLVHEFNAMLREIQTRDAELNRHQEHLEHMVQERTLELEASQQELLRKNQLLVLEIQRRGKAEMIKDEIERINRHDLKSGLSLVIGYPELLLKQGGLTQEQCKMLRRVSAAGYRMLDMIQNQLNIFKMEKGIYTLNLAPQDGVEIVCALEEEFTPLLASQGVTLNITLNGREVIGDESMMLNGEGPLVRAMLRNLIQNAIEACNKGDRVSIELEDSSSTCITIANPTPVPVEIRRRFFEKYTTFGKENGTGLGTYFASLIARLHGANIAMNTDDTTGTVIRILWKGPIQQRKTSN